MNEGARVLLVDDDADLLQLLNIRLKREGYEVQTASDARQALDCLSRQPPGAVITDLKMSRMDGMELLAEIERQFPVLPVIVLTAHGTIPDAVEATQRGAFAFLTKPIKHQELLECLQKALSVSAGPGVFH